ncbi:MAG: ROK family protein [Nitrospinae bacterium]|nr:ROK family protein [Nitrospinota bacterium]MBF0633265.1 ROK family protein [Nitrospinota bacterium]
MNANSYIIGIDLGGTNMRVAAVSSAGEILCAERLKTGASEGYEAVIKRIASAVLSVSGQMPAKPSAVGLAVPGAIDFAKGVVTCSPNFPDWSDVPVARDVSNLLGLPVVIENDANAAAVGEGWSGSAKGVGSFVMITLGTGVGGGVVLDGRVWRGSSGMAGEIGHIPVRDGGRICGCGKLGCLEAYASANAVARTARERIGEEKARQLLGLANGVPEKIDSNLMAQNAGMGDPFCVEIFDQAGRDIGKVMATLALTLDISHFVIGGGMAEALPFLLGSMRRAALDHAYTLNEGKLEIVKATLGDDAGIIGAAWMGIASARPFQS